MLTMVCFKMDAENVGQMNWNTQSCDCGAIKFRC